MNRINQAAFCSLVPWREMLVRKVFDGVRSLIWFPPGREGSNPAIRAHAQTNEPKALSLSPMPTYANASMPAGSVFQS